MKLILPALIILICFTFQIKSQTQSKINPKLYAKNLALANEAFDTEDYVNAISFYQKVLSIDPSHEISILNSLISRIRLNQPADSCNSYLSKLKNSTTPEAQFYLGKNYHLNYNFEEAIKCFKNYKNIDSKNRLISDVEINYNINCSKNAIELMNQQNHSIIRNLGDNINTSYSEYAPLMTPDEKILYFTSKRQGSTGNLKDIYGNYYKDIYVAEKDENAAWKTPVNIGLPINTDKNDVCVALSLDGNQMIVYRNSEGLVSGDLYLSRMDFNGWSNPEKLGPEINSPYIETSACFSADTSVIYFSSNRPGGFGGKDIYRVKKLPNGKWSQPMNLGTTVNTDKDEDYPFFHADGITLYFSSKGHNTMGDYDIFKTSLNPETNTFSTLENIGFPINTVNNDIFFRLNTSGAFGYYSSIKKDTYGGFDIYLIDNRFNNNDLKVKVGKVVFENMPNKAKITLIDIENKKVSGVFNANTKTGNFILLMNPLKSYKAIVEEDGFQTIMLDIEPLANELSEKELIFSLTKKP